MIVAAIGSSHQPLRNAKGALEFMGADDHHEDMLERTRVHEAAIIYGTFHTYPVM